MYIKKGTDYVSWRNDYVRVVAVLTKEDKTKTVIVANLRAPGGKAEIPYALFCAEYTEKLPLQPTTAEHEIRRTDPKFKDQSHNPYVPK